MTPEEFRAASPIMDRIAELNLVSREMQMAINSNAERDQLPLFFRYGGGAKDGIQINKNIMNTKDIFKMMKEKVDEEIHDLKVELEKI